MEKLPKLSDFIGPFRERKRKSIHESNMFMFLLLFPVLQLHDNAEVFDGDTQQNQQLQAQPHDVTMFLAAKYNYFDIMLFKNMIRYTVTIM